MKKTIFLLFILVFSVFACVNKNASQTIQNWHITNDTLLVDNQFVDNLPQDQCKQLYIDTGNDIFRSHIGLNDTYDQDFIYNFIAANKYNFHFGYMYGYMVFASHFPCVYNEPVIILDSLDVDSRKMVLNWVLDAAHAGVMHGKLVFNRMSALGVGVVKNTKLEDLMGKSNVTKPETKKEDESFFKLKFIGSHNNVKNDHTEYTVPVTPTFESKEDQRLICQEGNIDAYKRVRELYKSHGIEREAFFYCIVMANRYHYQSAYLDVYMCLWQAFNGGKKAEIWDMTRFDPKSRDFAVHYLMEAAKLGNYTAKTILANNFMGGVK